MIEIDEQVRNLEAARKKVNDIVQERAKLEGQLELEKSSLALLERESQEKFDTPIDELPELSEGLSQEADESLARAQEILGLGVA
jgi:predicted  nucleic acid-binding Zn-ribbon protein